MSLKYWLIIAALGIVWGSSFLFNEILLRELGPLMVSLGRTGLGAVGCWAYVLLTRKRVSLSWGLIGGMLFLGVLNFALPFAIYPLSQQYVTSGVAGIVNATTPVMVVIVTHFWAGGERASLPKILGVVLGMAGVAILAVPALGHESELFAILFMLLAPLCYAFAFNFARRFRDIDPTIVAALALTGGTIAIAPVAIWIEGIPVITRFQTWAALAVIGFALTSVAFIVFYWLLPIVGPTNTSTVTFIAPVSAVALGAFILGEKLLPEHAAGAVAIFCGMLLIDGRVLNWFRAKDQPNG